jgi:hypothetical protein
MSHTLKSILECIISHSSVKSAIACSDEAIDLLEDVEEVCLYCETQADAYDLMLVCGKERFITDPFISTTIVVDGLRNKANRLNFNLISKMKSLGYNTLTFNNDDIAVYTKDDKIASALRRPLVTKVKQVPTPATTSLFLRVEKKDNTNER